MTDFLIGRQPIFDRDLNTYAYELLFRSADVDLSSSIDGSLATNQVITDALLDKGLETMVGPHLAFINFTQENLLEETALLLPKERVVVEILENVCVDSALIEAVKTLSKKGYRIALDDFVLKDEWAPLLKHSDVIKIDVLSLDNEAIREHVKQLKAYPVKLLAEKVETEAEYQEFRDLGFDYFQGYFLSKPSIVCGKRAEIPNWSSAQLLAEINKSDIEPDELVSIISRDTGLSYKLLRYINSAAFALPEKIDSIKRAIVYLGFNEMKRWASLIALSALTEKPSEYIRVAFIRAKMCERLADLSQDQNKDTYFLVGLLSTLDCMLETTMQDIVESLPLATEVSQALVSQHGGAGKALRCSIDFENWTIESNPYQDVSLPTLGEAYLESVAWGDNSSSQVISTA